MTCEVTAAEVSSIDYFWILGTSKIHSSIAPTSTSMRVNRVFENRKYKNPTIHIRIEIMDCSFATAGQSDVTVFTLEPSNIPVFLNRVCTAFAERSLLR